MTSTHHSAGESEHFFTHDALFNVTGAVDQTTTAIVERYAYDAYGARRVMDAAYNGLAASAIGAEYGFTGRRVDPGTGLQLNRWRYLHTGLGRWVSRDPIEYLSHNLSLYCYVTSQPTASVDPLGLFDCQTDRYLGEIFSGYAEFFFGGSTQPQSNSNPNGAWNAPGPGEGFLNGASNDGSDTPDNPTPFNQAGFAAGQGYRGGDIVKSCVWRLN